MCCAPGKLRAAAVALCAALLLAACSTRLSAPERVRLGADGATAALAADILTAYETEHPETTVSLTPTSRDVALGALEAGDLDALLLVLPIERDTLFHTPAARLPFALIAHPDAPVSTLTPREARSLFSGQAAHWPGTTQPVQVVAQEDGATSRLALAQFVLGTQPLTPLARLAADDAHAVELVGALPGAISLVPLAAADASVQTLAIGGVTPTWEAASAEQYPFVAYVEYVSVEEPQAGQRAFLEWLFEAEGQAALDGYALPLQRGDR